MTVLVVLLLTSLISKTVHSEIAGKEVVFRWTSRQIFTATDKRLKGNIMDMTNGVNFPLAGATIGRALLRNILREECALVFDTFPITSRRPCGSDLLHIVDTSGGYFWHVTDFHWDYSYGRQNISCEKDVKSRGVFGNYRCDAPWTLVVSSVNGMKLIKPDADFVLWTGDSSPRAKYNATLDFELNESILGRVTKLIKRAFPTVPVFPTTGNHDYFPKHQFPPHGSELYDRLFNRWKIWIGQENEATFRKGAYYTLKTPTALRIVGLNTNLYYTSNKQVDNIDDPADQFVWLENVLKYSNISAEKVLITGHISTGIMPNSTTFWMYERFNTRLNNILIKYADIITGMFFGHGHCDFFKVYKDHTGAGVLSAFIAPSVTPWKDHNPGIRLLKYDRSTGRILDYNQYYMNLSDANNILQSNWKLEYQATSAYNLTDLSPVSMNELLRKITNPSSPYFRTFLQYFTVSVDHPKECDQLCHARLNCAFSYHDYQTYYRVYQLNKLIIKRRELENS